MKPEEFKLGKAFGIDPVKARKGEGDTRDLGILYGARDAMNSASSILAHASSRAYLDAATDDELREDEASELVSRIDYCTDEKRGELPVQRKGETR